MSDSASTHVPQGDETETSRPALNLVQNEDKEAGPPMDPKKQADEDWARSPHNPWNWPASKKLPQMAMLCLSALLATIGTSISTSATAHFMEEFHISRVVAILQLTLFVIALGVGPLVGGPLSETVGRYPVYLIAVPAGGLFSLGAGFARNFGLLCFLRFMSGLCWAPTVSVAAGTISDVFAPSARGFPSSIFLLICFLGPGIGPVVGSFTVVRHGWRWTQWILALMSVPATILAIFTHESFRPKIQRRLAKAGKDGSAPAPRSPPIMERLREFVNVGLIRPIQMLFVDPIVGFICLYVAVEFGTLFSFFAGVPYTFSKIHGFSLEQSGLVFISVIIGCFLALITIILCDVLIYRKQIPKYPPHQVPPEHRLYGALIASIGLPLGLFWYAWTARPEISWASPAAAIIPFAWGNLCLFVSLIQYITDTYTPTVVASAASANSLARYTFAGVFPLFIIQMLEAIGVGWGFSILGFASLVLMPFPWFLYKYGARVRARRGDASA